MNLFTADVGQGKVHIYDSGNDRFHAKVPQENLINLCISELKNGDTLVITGVLQDSDNISTSKVPILGDIPLLGSLFRTNSTQKRKSELIILVTPKILKDK